MPLLTRADGVPFVIYTYREVITAKKSALLQREIELLAKEHGNFCRFFGLPDDNIEAVFSREAGYLLGETIWQFFSDATDLIYCEQLQDTDKAILVIIRENSVYLDAELPILNIVDELIPLIGSHNAFQIYVYGNVPLAKKPAEDKFAFEAAMVKKFTQLKKPVFPSLEPDEDLKLIPLREAQEELPTLKTNKSRYIIPVLIFLAVFYGIWKTVHKPKAINQTVQTQAVYKPKDPYEAFKQALTTPAPREVIVQISKALKDVLTIPGWAPRAMDYENNQATFTLESVGGDASLLLAWSRRTQIDLQIKEGKAEVNYNLDVNNRLPPGNIYNLRDTTAKLYDYIARIFPDTKATIGKVDDEGIYSTVEVSFSFIGVSSTVLELFANALKDLPVVLDKIELQNIDAGIISGNINLIVIGSVRSA